METIMTELLRATADPAIDFLLACGVMAGFFLFYEMGPSIRNYEDQEENQKEA